MAGEVGQAYIRIRPNTAGFQEEASSSLKKSLVTLGKVVGGFFAAQQAFSFAKSSVETAASIQKSTEAIQETMGKAATSVVKANEDMAGSYGISAKAADDFSARIGLMGQNIGLNKITAAQMALNMEHLAGAFGAVRGQDPTPYLDKLSTALIGNTRGLKQMGIVLNSTNELQEAQRLGFIKTTVDAQAVAAAHAKVAEYQAKVTEEMQKYGKASPQALGATASLKTAQDELSKALAGKSTSTVASLTAAQKAQVVMGVATQSLGKLQTEAAKHSGDLANQQIKLSAEWSNAKDEIGLALLPAVTQLVSVFARALPGAMTQVAASFKTGIAAIQPIVPPLVSGFKALFTLMGDNKGTVEAIAGAFVAYKIAMTATREAMSVYSEVAKVTTTVMNLLSGETRLMTAAAAQQQAELAGAAAGQEAYNAATLAGKDAQEAAAIATKASTTAQEGFDAALVANPIGIVIAAIAALGLGLYELYQHSATARDIMNELFADIKTGANASFGWIVQNVFPAFESGMQSLIHITESILGSIQSYWHRWGSQILAVMNALFQPIKVLVKGTMQVIWDEIHIFLDLIHGNWSKVWKDIGKLIGDVLGNILQVLAATIKLMLQAVIAGAKIIGPAALQLGKALVNTVVNEIKHLPGQILSVIKGIPHFITSVIPDIVTAAFNLGKRIVSGTISGIGNLGGSLKSSLESHIKSALSDLNPFSPIEDGAQIYIATPITQGTVDALTANSSGLQDQLNNTITPILQQVMTMQQKNAQPIGTSITDAIVSPIGTLAGSLQTAIVNAAQAAIAGAKKALGIKSPSTVFQQEIGEPLSNGILAGMGGLKQGLIDQITKAAKAATGVAGGLAAGGNVKGTPAVSENQKLGYQMMLQAGWPAGQWGALQSLWTRESGWNQYAKNPSSGAFGIPQELGHAVSASYLAGNVQAQIAWGLDYIRSRYGSPSAAWAHEMGFGWYGGGGVVPGPPGQPQIAVVHGGEKITPADKGGDNFNIQVVTNNPNLWGETRDVMNAVARAKRR